MSEAVILVGAFAVTLAVVLVVLAVRCLSVPSVVEDRTLARDAKREEARPRRPKQPRHAKQGPKLAAPAPEVVPAAAPKVVTVPKTASRDVVSLEEMVSFLGGGQKSVAVASGAKKQKGAEATRSPAPADAKPARVKKGWHVVTSKREKIVEEDAPSAALASETATKPGVDAPATAGGFAFALSSVFSCSMNLAAAPNKAAAAVPTTPTKVVAAAPVKTVAPVAKTTPVKAEPPVAVAPKTAPAVEKAIVAPDNKVAAAAPVKESWGSTPPPTDVATFVAPDDRRRREEAHWKRKEKDVPSASKSAEGTAGRSKPAASATVSAAGFPTSALFTASSHFLEQPRRKQQRLARLLAW
jgi:heme exporter protein D